MTADDDVIEFEDRVYAALSFVAGQNTELQFIEIVECLTATHEPRGRLVEAERVELRGVRGILQ